MYRHSSPSPADADCYIANPQYSAIEGDEAMFMESRWPKGDKRKEECSQSGKSP